jgi:hypothetical protein
VALLRVSRAARSSCCRSCTHVLCRQGPLPLLLLHHARVAAVVDTATRWQAATAARRTGQQCPFVLLFIVRVLLPSCLILSEVLVLQLLAALPQLRNTPQHA